MKSLSNGSWIDENSIAAMEAGLMKIVLLKWKLDIYSNL